jgi:glycosyltransferase involved in cell wall biosynthesis
LLQRVRELDVPVLDARVRNAANALARPHTFLQMARVARIVRRQRIQVVHGYLFHANWFGALTGRLAGVPAVIVSKRNVDVHTRMRDRWACRIVNRLADRVTATSQAVRDHVHRSEGCPPEKIVVIPNGVDASRFRQASGEPATEVFRSGPGQVVIGTVTRLVWYKGLDQLLTAATLVVRSHPAARFVVVGDGPLRQRLEKKAEELGLNGTIRFLGSVPGAWRLLPQFDLFVLPSLKEGMSNSLLEAMAAAKPVVATAVGGNPEVVIDGETGFLVPPRDPQALANAILRVLGDRKLARSLGEAGRVRAEAEYTVEKVVARLERLYDSVLAVSSSDS